MSEGTVKAHLSRALGRVRAELGGSDDWNPESTKRAEEPAEMEALDPALKQALGDFKESVHAWSDAAYTSRPRSVRAAIVRRAWRLAAGWSLAAMSACGAISGGVYEHHERVVASQLAAQRAAAQQRQEAIARAREKGSEEEDMLASVDTAVSREVPARWSRWRSCPKRTRRDQISTGKEQLREVCKMLNCCPGRKG